MHDDHEESECPTCALVDEIIAVLSDDDRDAVEHLRALNTVAAIILSNMNVQFFEDHDAETAKGNA
jgi:hypothetical protein